MSDLLPRRIVLALYRDPRQLGSIEQPGFAGEPPGVIIELALQSRLRRAMTEGAPDAPRFSAPVLFAPTWRRTVPSLLQLAAETHPEATGPVVLVCHTLDARYFVEALGAVSATRLLWHPADRADHRLGELLGRVQRSALRPSLLHGGLYLSSTGRAATGEDWLRAASCPILTGMTRMGRPQLAEVDGRFRVSA